MTAHASEAVATLCVSTDPTIITVIERFAVPNSRKEDAIEAARHHIHGSWLSDDSFIGAALLRGRDHAGISSYAQWSRTTREISPDAPPSARSISSALGDFEAVESRIFSVDFIESASPGQMTTPLSLKDSPYVHYGLFSVRPEDQNRVFDLGRANSGKALGIPGLLSINWHRSLDGAKIVNMGSWTDFDGTAELEKQDGFQINAGKGYWVGYADWSAERFDVVEVVTR